MVDLTTRKLWGIKLKNSYLHEEEPPLPGELHGEHSGGATPSQINSRVSIQELSPLRSTPWGAYRWSHPLSDQLPGEHTGGSTLSQINSLGSIQEDSLLSDQLHGEHTGRATPFQINSLGSMQEEPPPLRSTPW